MRNIFPKAWGTVLCPSLIYKHLNRGDSIPLSPHMGLIRGSKGGSGQPCPMAIPPGHIPMMPTACALVAETAPMSKATNSKPSPARLSGTHFVLKI